MELVGKVEKVEKCMNKELVGKGEMIGQQMTNEILLGFWFFELM
jgi:hypothetical protein